VAVTTRSAMLRMKSVGCRGGGQTNPLAVVISRLAAQGRPGTSAMHSGSAWRDGTHGSISAQAADDESAGGRMRALALSPGLGLELGTPQDRAQCQGQDLLLQKRFPEPARPSWREARYSVSRSAGNAVYCL